MHSPFIGWQLCNVNRDKADETQHSISRIRVCLFTTTTVFKRTVILKKVELFWNHKECSFLKAWKDESENGLEKEPTCTTTQVLLHPYRGRTAREPREVFVFLSHSPECVFVLTETRAFTVHAIFARLAHPVPAVWTTEARLTETASINVVAACTISTVTHTFAVLTIGACSTVLVTPEGRTQKGIWIQKVLFHVGKSA